ncbi:MAG: hypothetical protein H6735_00940 [Alphaproteobacteria bacterium]|nr:hypothetical protein [Alphaproteobacteria bacterium]
MTWRPWVVFAVLMLAALLNGTLIIVEQIPKIDAGPEIIKVDERLRTLQYTAANRRANFEVMGMDPELADATARWINRYEKQQAERIYKMLEEQSAEVADVFCSSERAPQPYAAMRYLVYEENGVRQVVNPLAMRRFEFQDWYATSYVDALYDHFERSQARKPDATIMAVGAVFTKREIDALDGVAPWSLGLVGSWGFGRLTKKEPRVQALVVEYFALMHFITELANLKRGICA